MDRTLTNLTPDLSCADPALSDRILTGHSAVLSQIEYFRKNFGQTESSWKKDGTRVTIVDETISRELFLPLRNAFPYDDYFSEESIETPDPVPLKAEFAGCSIRSTGRITMRPESLNVASPSRCCTMARPFTDSFTTTAETSCCKAVPGLVRSKELPRSMPRPNWSTRRLPSACTFPFPQPISIGFVRNWKNGEYAVRVQPPSDWPMSQPDGSTAAWSFAPSLGIAQQVIRFARGQGLHSASCAKLVFP